MARRPYRQDHSESLDGDASLSDRVTGLEFGLAGVKQQLGENARQVDEGFTRLTAQMSEQNRLSKPDTNLWFKVYPVIAGFVTVGWFIINAAFITPITKDVSALQTALNALTQDVQATERLSSASTIADSSSRQDRADIQKQIDHNSGIVSELVRDTAAMSAEVAADKREYEAELKMISNNANMSSAENEKWRAIFWNKLFPGIPYPTGVTFHPEMYNPNPTSNPIR